MTECLVFSQIAKCMGKKKSELSTYMLIWINSVWNTSRAFVGAFEELKTCSDNKN